LEERRLAERLVAQGERYLAQADVVSARLLFRRAAEAGFAMAAVRLGATYDPAELSRLGTESVAADEAEARKWYERARAMGAPDAEDRLARLGRR
jgi:TPR repeat protein